MCMRIWEPYAQLPCANMYAHAWANLSNVVYAYLCDLSGLLEVGTRAGHPDQWCARKRIRGLTAEFWLQIWGVPRSIPKWRACLSLSGNSALHRQRGGDAQRSTPSLHHSGAGCFWTLGWSCHTETSFDIWFTEKARHLFKSQWTSAVSARMWP